MADNDIPYVVPANVLEKVRAVLGQEQIVEFVSLFNAVGTESPNPEQIEELRIYLHNHPELSLVAGNLNDWMQGRIIGGIVATPALREATDARLELMRRDMGHEYASPQEQMLIEHVVLCWVRFQEVSYLYQNHMDNSPTLTSSEYWETRLSAAQRRYLRAVETLARVRRLLSRGKMQINIAGQQIVQNGL